MTEPQVVHITQVEKNFLDFFRYFHEKLLTNEKKCVIFKMQREKEKEDAADAEH